jgi:aquaporin related protein
MLITLSFFLVFNPAVTIALMLTKPQGIRKMPLTKGAIYIVAQLLGGLVGAWLIDLVQPESPGAATVLADGVSVAQGLFLEMFATSVLTMAVLMLGAEGFGGPMAAFGIGMSLFISALCAGPYTGASLNPARTLGPAIVANDYGRAHWIYYVGPVLGSLLAAGYWHILKFLDVTGVREPDSENSPEKPGEV